MVKTSVAGKFITFEGGEGAGKTTLIRAIYDHLSQHGKQVTITREPGGTPQGEAIRDLVVKGAADRWDAQSETALFLTARRMHVAKLIGPALQDGHIVLCDRFSDSTIVYQGIAGQLGADYVRQLEQLIVGHISPDLTLLLDIDPNIGLARAQQRAGSAAAEETRFESHQLAFHEAIRRGFTDLAKAHPERIVTLSAEQTPAQLMQEALVHVLRCIGE